MLSKPWKTCSRNFKPFFKQIFLKRYFVTNNISKLRDRGIFQDIFPDTASKEIADLINGGPQTVYAGFDPTADSLHIGNLLVLVSLLHLQRAGHQVIALVGGATAQVGDPSGRLTERSEISKDIVQKNTERIHANIEQIFKNHEKYLWTDRGHQSPLKPPVIINNADWYKNIDAIQFMRIARHFRMGSLMNRTSIRERLSSPQGMSCAEFMYQIFQSYDWLYLLDKYNCRFQIGGSDQLGNIKSGHDLIGKFHKTKCYGLTLPLITTESGEKLGKSAGNSVWLFSDRSSEFSFYQYWIRQKDIDSLKLLKLFTFLKQPEIDHLEALQKKNPSERPALKKLAQEVTLLVHGENGVKTAEKVSDALYSNKLKSLEILQANELAQAFEGARTVELLPEPGLTVLDLALKAKCFPSQHDALRIISAGGFYINHQRAKNINEAIVPGIHILPTNTTLIRVGKKNYHIVRWIK
ncbi:tyrosine--tRNA ligase, mitochondrial [Chrysoperla carnea]|uniref:tyrosine--tRNA ligase, mitochondrial n=1 Tax=Chrysoperla carnea TaxID=189513 RepID=UPI001D06742C|nr:tyrosine--tRNA ligase, mitochondrial [Chrysoperla carnea]